MSTLTLVKKYHGNKTLHTYTVNGREYAIHYSARTGTTVVPPKGENFEALSVNHAVELIDEYEIKREQGRKNHEEMLRIERKLKKAYEESLEATKETLRVAKYSPIDYGLVKISKSSIRFYEGQIAACEKLISELEEKDYERLIVTPWELLKARKLRRKYG